MTFQTLTFLIFFALVLAGYWGLSGRRAQNLFLLVASFVFYGWAQPWYVFLLGGVITAAYIAGRHPRLLLPAVMALLLLPLLVFKYAGFLVRSFGVESIGKFDILFDLMLPVGISFFTFQAIAYVVDVRRGKVQPATSFVDFALFLSFFPQLVAGPIERAESLLLQIYRQRRWDLTRFVYGVRLAMWGAVQKLVIGDHAGIIVEKIFFLERPGAALLGLSSVLFAIQIVADFSGYTDMARGIARMLGFRLSRNFFHPYLARNPQEFWRRWHMTLSRWIRDYLYIPLGGSRQGELRTALNLILAFTLCGLWHGAAWNFALWGAYWGALLVVFRLLFSILPRASIGGVVITFFLTCLGWLLFREADMSWLAANLLTPGQVDWKILLGLSVYTALLSLPLTAQVWIDHRRGACLRSSVNLKTVGFGITIMWWAVLLFQADTGTDFIYFQF